jgi:hypothetical protein
VEHYLDGTLNPFHWHSIGFEYAAQPGVTSKEKAEKLHFAVVGGGPTVCIALLLSNQLMLSEVFI